jgi:O-antigen/teichoic acid export membrane protein
VLRRWSFNRSYEGVVPAARLPDGLAARFRVFAWRTSLMLLPSIVLWDRSEVFFIRRYCTTAEVAFYSLGFGLVRQVQALLQPFLYPVTSNMLVEYGRGVEGTTRMARIGLRYCLILALPLVWGLSAVGAPAIVLIYGAAYAPAASVLTAVAFFGAAQALVTPVHQALLAAERQQLLTKWVFAAAAANVSLDLLLIPRYGAMGAALANGVAQAAAFLSLLLYARGAIGLRLTVAEIGRPLLSAAVMAALAAAISRCGPPIVAVPAAILAGALVYALMLRVTRALDRQDRARLSEVGRMLPSPLRAVFEAVVSAVTHDPIGVREQDARSA